MAIAVGYTPEEAKILSDGCWSLDMNDTTTALPSANPTYWEYVKTVLATHTALHSPMAKKLCDKNDPALDQLVFNTGGGDFGRIGRGVFYHALYQDEPKDDARHEKGGAPSLDKPWKQYIKFELAKMKDQGWPEDVVQKYKLILIGQYLHMLLDSYVHPPNPWIGHSLQGHEPDYTANHKDWYKNAVRRVLTELRSDDFIQGSKGQFTSFGVKDTEKEKAFAEGLVNALADDGYKGKAPGSLEESDKPGTVKASCIAAIEKFMNDYLQKRDDSTNTGDGVSTLDDKRVKLRDIQPVSEKFSIPAYTHIQYVAPGVVFSGPPRIPGGTQRTGSADNLFWTQYGDNEPGPVLDNFITWILKREKEKDPDAIKALERVRESIRAGFCLCQDNPAQPSAPVPAPMPLPMPTTNPAPATPPAPVPNAPVPVPLPNPTTETRAPAAPPPATPAPVMLPNPTPRHDDRGHFSIPLGPVSPPRGIVTGFGGGSSMTPFKIPEIPHACKPGIIDAVIEIIDKSNPGHGKGDGKDENCTKGDTDMTIICKSKEIDQALTKREQAEREATAARNLAVQQQKNYAAAVARYQADLARYNAAVKQQQDYAAAVARYQADLARYNAAVKQQQDYAAAVARYQEEVAYYNAALQQQQYQAALAQHYSVPNYSSGSHYQNGSHGGGMSHDVDWGRAALSIAGAFLGGNSGHHR
ncbi:TolC family protein [Telmatocola sphagniphila]|uniref:TolC family protein n=1 Tax=Telmatocola sphagniphila TaxID=1123043 RepID=A0A8E6B1I9_9BACT|nr:hypothetical protein [Telmatocola sphagniphila]QVL30300.1 TolC family protein [Telmatocola sphagniphila]